MNTLMHICCAPCANRPIDLLRSEGLSVAGFWFNPNIHPYTEYQARKRTLEEYSKEIGMKLIIGGSYDLRTFITNVADNIDGRCAYCYRVRMEETARYAAENGYDSFTTSLLISPYQNHEAIRAGEIRGGVSVPGLPLPVPGRAGVRPGARILHAEILRLYFQRGGPVYGRQAEEEGQTGRCPDNRAINCEGPAETAGPKLFWSEEN